jgi:trehalose utilization protein
LEERFGHGLIIKDTYHYFVDAQSPSHNDATMKSLCRKLGAGLGIFLFAMSAMAGGKIRVVVWDERQPAQKQAYTNFLGNAIADYLSKQPDLSVKSVGLDDPDQGLSKEILDNCDVLIWWGHQRHNEVKDEHVHDIVRRIELGKLNLLALHSAHWSKVFIDAMGHKAIEDAIATVPVEDRAHVKLKILQPDLGGLAPSEGPLTPWAKRTKGTDGQEILEVKLPSCVFPAVKNEGSPSHITTLLPQHPIAKDVPKNFDIPQTEIYAGPFHVPKPQAQIFAEKWDSNETFPAGCFWTLGKGKIFYFRPGHETYPILTQPVPRKIVENAVRFLGQK